MFAFFCLLILLSICFPKSKINTLLWGVFLIVVVVCTTRSADVIALETRYNIVGFAGFPMLFKEIMRFCIENNFSFLQVKFAYILIVLILLYILIKSATKYSAFCLMLISIYPGWCFSGQIRNTIAAIIVMLGVMYLVQSSNKRKKYIYIMCVVIASLIHPSCIVYFLVLFCLNDKVSSSGKVLTECFAVIILLYSNVLYRVVSIFVHNERVLQYLRVRLTANLFASTVVIVGQIIFTYFFIWLFNANKIKAYMEKNNISYRRYDMLIRVNRIFLILIPFYGINHAIFRIYKYLMIVNYACVCDDAYNGRLLKIKIIVILLAIAFLSIVGQVIVDGGIRDIFHLFDALDFTQLRLIF